MSALDEILAALQALPPEARAEVEKVAIEATAHLKWLPNVGPQEQAYFHPADVLLYGGQAGGGKGLELHREVLTPFGWRAIGDLKVGSSICATDGTVQRIIGYFPRGEQPLYRLTWSDGSQTICDADHIWLGWLAGKSRKIGNVPTCGEGSAAKWTTTMLAAHYAKGESAARFGIPVMSAPAAFNVHGENHGSAKHVARILPPYVLGILLGDGHLGTGVSFSKPDIEIADRCDELMVAAFGEDARLSRYDYERCPQFRFPNACVKPHLEDLSLLGKRSPEKFIPRIYLFAAVEERWELLRGLMDTDGWCEVSGDCYFGSTSKQLAEDVRHLARSLGAIVTWTERDPTYSYQGETRTGLHFYTLRIKMRDPARMFTLERKRARCLDAEPQWMAIFLDRIEPAGQAPTVCIAVSHPNSLFITEDFIVTHNTDLGLGLAFTAHERSLVIRRKYTDLGGLIDRAKGIHGSTKGFNGSPPPRLTFEREGKTCLIDFVGNQHPGDEAGQQGRPYDLKYIDEAVQMLESQIRFHIGWMRSTSPGQRTRMVLGTNPPINSDGDWIVGFFRPWLDITHPKPAAHGELRWFVRAPDDSEDIEVDGPELIEVPGAPHPLRPMSRSFVPAKLSDNPYLVKTDYGAKLDSLPEPLRSAVRDGNFMAFRADSERQVIPTQWIVDAQARWMPRPPDSEAMVAIAADIAQGGADETIISPRYGGYFAEQIARPGKETPDGASVVALILAARRDAATIVLDMGGGYGGAASERLNDNAISHVRFNGAHASMKKTKDGSLGFVNRRAEMYWTLREELDPEQEGGSVIALPPDPELRSQLAAMTYKVTARGIQIDSKDEVKKRLGKSPDRADSIAMAMCEGNRAEKRARARGAYGGRPRQTRANAGYMAQKRW